MVWIVAGTVVILMGVFLFARSPMRSAAALTLAAQRAARRKDFAAAARLCRESHAMAMKLREPARSRVTSQIEIEWAAALYRQGSLREAEELLRRGFSHTRAAGCYPQMKPAYLIWGDLCSDEGRHLEAEQHYRTALHGEEQIGNVAGMIFDLQRLGDSLVRQGRRKEAEAEIQRAIELETRVVHEQMMRDGKDPARHRVISWSLPDLHFCREQYADACRLYWDKVEFWEKSVTRPDNIDLGHLQMRLAACEARTGRRAEAVEIYTRAEKTFQREWGEGHPKAAAREARLALTREDGLTLARKAVGVQEG